MGQAERFVTHRIENQVPPLPPFNAFLSDGPLREGVVREGGGWGEAYLTDFGRLSGGELLELGFAANVHKPALKLYDRYGNRLDEVEFHSAYHRIMELAMAHGVHAFAWRNAERLGAHVVRVAGSEGSMQELVMRPIGQVRSPYTETSQIPKGPGAEHTAEGLLDVLPELEAGLADIEGFSHLFVIWVFHLTEGYELVAFPPADDRPHGVFATRSPKRPNPIGLSVVSLLGREGPRLRVRGIDMLDGTPILDIKPYLSSVPAEGLRRGWLDAAEARRGK